MSFFNKLFGAEDKSKKAKAPPPPPKDNTEQKKIKIQAACNALDLKIKEFQDKEKKFQYKIDLLKNKAKQLLQADKKKEAKKYVEEATRVQKQMEVCFLSNSELHPQEKSIS